ncbi:MAG: glycosyltransferase [Ginsengibacter sp.]
MINGNNFNSPKGELRILVAPLDWGLGHATRCIPIINELILLNCAVYIAASGSNYFLLKKEFPTLAILHAPGYNIKYSGKKRWLAFKLAVQFPHIIFLIWKENKWVKKIVSDYSIDAVISDNRFGMHSKKIPSVYITHQLVIKTGHTFSEKLLQKLHYRYIKKYHTCWIPDGKENGLAGELSHQENLPFNISYLGPLSRFERLTDLPKMYDILISISGPEPQRTIFEKIILFELQTSDKRILFVRGLPGEKRVPEIKRESIKIVNHLSAFELNEAFQQSEIIISRSGYTTVMDLVKLEKNAILVPTPGQTEQEYLSRYLKDKKYFYSVDQVNFSLETVLAEAVNFPFIKPKSSFTGYKKIINEFVQSLKTGNIAHQ